MAKDVDEALWEEVETRLRHQSRTTADCLLLMALGGAIAAMGFVVHNPAEQAISFVAGAIVAPGFEPLAKVSVGLALRRWGVAARGLGSAALGYLVLALSAALLFLVLRLTGAVTVGGFAGNHGVESLAHPALRGVLLSACGALAGIVMLTTYRQYLLPRSADRTAGYRICRPGGSRAGRRRTRVGVRSVRAVHHQRRAGLCSGGAGGGVQASNRASSEADGVRAWAWHAAVLPDTPQTPQGVVCIILPLSRWVNKAELEGYGRPPNG